MKFVLVYLVIAIVTGLRMHYGAKSDMASGRALNAHEEKLRDPELLAVMAVMGGLMWPLMGLAAMLLKGR